MKVHVIVGVWHGVVKDVRAGDEVKMNEVEREMCKEYEVPYDGPRRNAYRDNGGESDVYHFIVDLE